MLSLDGGLLMRNGSTQKAFFKTPNKKTLLIDFKKKNVKLSIILFNANLYKKDINPDLIFNSKPFTLSYTALDSDLPFELSLLHFDPLLNLLQSTSPLHLLVCVCRGLKWDPLVRPCCNAIRLQDGAGCGDEAIPRANAGGKCGGRP